MSTEVQGGKGRGLCAYNVSHGMQRDDVPVFSERTKMKKANNTNTHRYYGLTSKKIPLTLGELASLLSVKFGINLSKRNLSHYLHGAGYKLSIISRGATSMEKSNLPDRSPEDWECLVSDPAARDAMTSEWGMVYDWLRNLTPVPRHVGTNEASQKSEKRSREDPGYETGEGRGSLAQISESRRDDDTGDDTTHNVDAYGEVVVYAA